MDKTAANMDELKPKSRFTGTVKKTVLAGAIVDIGLDKPGVVPISRLRKEPVKRVEDVVKAGDQVDVWVHRINKDNGNIELTMIEPLALEWREIKKGDVVKGKVVQLEKFGAFVEIGAERPGLVHVSELAHGFVRTVEDAVSIGDEVEAQVLDVSRRKRKIKLSMKALQMDPAKLAVELEADEEENEPVPTAMEIALRRAMDSTGDAKPIKEQSGKKKGSERNQQEEIYARTLQNKVRTE
jgi:predicted RNA-binding protein with RPS1 domain